MSIFDDPNREAVGLAPIWSGAISGDPPPADPPPEGEPDPDPEPAAGKRARGARSDPEE